MPPRAAKEPANDQVRPLDIVTTHPWRHALFTTYALSLSFYETQLHKLGLARNGCRDIRIVADADGYQLSLSERQSHRVGNEYRLTPAALPDGVFHPKITWLAGKEIDLVLLGSGNLTFGGFGKNVECLDLIRSDRDPAFFAEIGDMLGAWAARENLQFAEQDWLAFWNDRAIQISTGAAPTEAPPRLLHSTAESIGQQLLEHVIERGEVVEVRSLSPFYDPDGDGILTFAESIGAPKLCIGLLPGREDHSAFPFHRNRQTSIDIRASRFSAPEDKRTLHAKVLELVISDGSSLVLTGSVNATRKSLLTSDNIETATLRWLPDSRKSPFHWKTAKLPASFRSSEFRKAGLGSRVLVSGRLTGEGILKGTLISSHSSEGSWDATLQRIDGTLTTLGIQVDSSGQFASPIHKLELFQHAAGLQLQVSHQDGRTGRGWVSVEGLLLAARRGFLSPATLMKLLGPDADEGDEADLLRYLATSAQRHLPAFASSVRSPRRGDTKEKDEMGKGATATVLPLEMLVPHELPNEASSGDASHRREEAMLNGLMHRVRTNLLRMQRGETGVQEIDEPTDDKAAEREQKERERSRKQLTVSLREFQERLQQLSTELAPGPHRAAALCMWFEVEFPILLRRLDQVEEAELFAKQWLGRCLFGQTSSNSSDALIGHVLSILLTLAAATLEREGTSPAGQRVLGRLHEQLETFCGNSRPADLCSEFEVLDTENPPVAAELLSSLSSAPSLATALEAILDTPTPRHQLQSILQAGTNGDGAIDDLPILGLPAAQQFRSMVENGRRPTLKELSSSSETCPHCHLKLRIATLLEVRHNRFGTCRHCGGFLLASI